LKTGQSTITILETRQGIMTMLETRQNIITRLRQVVNEAHNLKSLKSFTNPYDKEKRK